MTSAYSNINTAEIPLSELAQAPAEKRESSFATQGGFTALHIFPKTTQRVQFSRQITTMGQNPKDNTSNQIPRTKNSPIQQNGNDIEMEDDEGSIETNADPETNTSYETARKKRLSDTNKSFF